MTVHVTVYGEESLQGSGATTPVFVGGNKIHTLLPSRV